MRPFKQYSIHKKMKRLKQTIVFFPSTHFDLKNFCEQKHSNLHSINRIKYYEFSSTSNAKIPLFYFYYHSKTILFYIFLLYILVSVCSIILSIAYSRLSIFLEFISAEYKSFLSTGIMLLETSGHLIRFTLFKSIWI